MAPSPARFQQQSLLGVLQIHLCQFEASVRLNKPTCLVDQGAIPAVT